MYCFVEEKAFRVFNTQSAGLLLWSKCKSSETALKYVNEDFFQRETFWSTN